jgi:hypothetical protein
VCGDRGRRAHRLYQIDRIVAFVFAPMRKALPRARA